MPAYQFICQGAQWLFEPDNYATEVVNNYFTHDCPQVTDTFHQDWNFSGGVQDLQLLFQVGLEIAAGTTPSWNAGAEFKAADDRRLK